MMPRSKGAEEDVMTRIIRFIFNTLGHQHAADGRAVGTPTLSDPGPCGLSGQLVSMPWEGLYSPENG
jgi:hypothetical protein